MDYSIFNWIINNITVVMVIYCTKAGRRNKYGY